MDIEFNEMTQQGGKLGVFQIFISDTKFLNTCRLSKGRYEASNFNMDNFTPFKENDL